jgi:hypothetical protein
MANWYDIKWYYSSATQSSIIQAPLIRSGCRRLFRNAKLNRTKGKISALQQYDKESHFSKTLWKEIRVMNISRTSQGIAALKRENTETPRNILYEGLQVNVSNSNQIKKGHMLVILINISQSWKDGVGGSYMHLYRKWRVISVMQKYVIPKTMIPAAATSCIMTSKSSANIQEV